MCDAPEIQPPAPAPQAPPTLEQLAPKAAKSTNSKTRKRSGLNRYKIGGPNKAKTNKLGGIPKKTGV